MKFNFLTLVLITATILTGCSLNVFSTDTNVDAGPAGVWRSVDDGSSWEKFGAVLSDSGGKNLDLVSVTGLQQDITEPNSWYALTNSNGLFYNYSLNKGWLGTLGKVGKITGVIVDPDFRCTVYASASQTIFKTIDCGRTWASVYKDTLPGVSITSIFNDPAYPRTIYSVNSKGDLVRSTDAGNKWSLVFKFNDVVTKVVISKGNRILYVATSKSGLWKSTDLGQEWSNFRDITTKIVPNSNQVLGLAVNDGGSIVIFNTPTSILKTNDGGATWLKYDLLTESSKTVIQTMTVNPSDFRKIYYVVANTLYISDDDGLEWKTRNLPSKRPVSSIVIDYFDKKTLYLAHSITSK